MIGSAVAPSPMATNQPRATCARENCATLSHTTHNTKNQLAKHAAMCEEWGDKKVTALAAAVKRPERELYNVFTKTEGYLTQSKIGGAYFK